MRTICTECDGTGISIGSSIDCCGNYDINYNCCNNPIQVPIQIQCTACKSTGFINNTKTRFRNENNKI